eukprot:scaffold105140_cov39-Tisochrysis_lutea.AAC.1
MSSSERVFQAVPFAPSLFYCSIGLWCSCRLAEKMRKHARSGPSELTPRGQWRTSMSGGVVEG